MPQVVNAFHRLAGALGGELLLIAGDQLGGTFTQVQIGAVPASIKKTWQTAGFPYALVQIPSGFAVGSHLACDAYVGAAFWPAEATGGYLDLEASAPTKLFGVSDSLCDAIFTAGQGAYLPPAGRIGSFTPALLNTASSWDSTSKTLGKLKTYPQKLAAQEIIFYNATSGFDYYAGPLFRFLGFPLYGVRKIRAQNWQLMIGTKSFNADTPHAVELAMAVYRSGVGVVGYICDTTATGHAANHPGKLRNNTAHQFRNHTFAGNEVASIQDGDFVIAEIWGCVHRPSPTTTTNRAMYALHGGTQESSVDADPVTGGSNAAVRLLAQYDLWASAMDISSVAPNAGPIGGGTPVTITGTGFQVGATVTIGGVAATSVVVVSDTSITCVTPAHAAGPVDVVVTVGAESTTLVSGFTYTSFTVAGLRPNVGPVAGGTEVKIIGSGFTGGVISVTFDGTNAINIVTVSDGVITCETPAHVAGSVNVIVAKDGAPSLLVNGFTYIADPVPSKVVFHSETPVSEILEWKTDIIVSDNGTEQRAAIRSVPRRSQTVRVVAQTQDDVKARLEELLFLKGQVALPYFQYATTITTESLAGSTQVYFDRARTDIRDGEYALIATPTGQYELVKVDTVTGTGATLTSALPTSIPVGSVIAPALRSIVDNVPVARRYSVHTAAEFEMKATSIQRRATLSRPGSTAVIPTLNGYPILDRRPLANQNVENLFDRGVTLFDNESGSIDYREEWLRTRVQGSRQFLVRRIEQPGELDWWRDFLDMVKGQLNPFLLPTYREDWYIQGIQSATILRLVGNKYRLTYFPMATYKRLRFWNAAGAYHDALVSAAVDAAAPNAGNDQLTISPGLPGGFTPTYVSNLLKVRLGEDIVSLDHYAFETILGLVIRTVDE